MAISVLASPLCGQCLSGATPESGSRAPSGAKAGVKWAGTTDRVAAAGDAPPPVSHEASMSIARQVQDAGRTVPDFPKKTRGSEDKSKTAKKPKMPCSVQRPSPDLRYAAEKDSELKLRLKMMNDVYLRLQIPVDVIAQVFVFDKSDLNAADKFNDEWVELFETAVVILVIEDASWARLWPAVWARAQKWYYYPWEAHLFEDWVTINCWAVLMGAEKEEELLQPDRTYTAAELDDKVRRTAGSRRRWRAKQQKKKFQGATGQCASSARDGQPGW